MSNKINLEEIGMSAKKEDTDNKVEKEENIVDPQKEIKKMYSLPFKVAMQNLKINEDDVLEAGKELLLKGKITKRFELPLGNYIVLTSRKASEELDFYTFMAEAIAKQYSAQEFDYLLKIRNIAVSMVELKIGDEVINFKDKSIEEKYQYLLDLSVPLMSMIVNITSSFWSLLILMMHPGAVDFLTKSLQK